MDFSSSSSRSSSTHRSSIRVESFSRVVADCTACDVMDGHSSPPPPDEAASHAGERAGRDGRHRRTVFHWCGHAVSQCTVTVDIRVTCQRLTPVCAERHPYEPLEQEIALTMLAVPDGHSRTPVRFVDRPRRYAAPIRSSTAPLRHATL